MNQMQADSEPVDYRLNPPITNEELNALFTASWPGHRWSDFSGVLAHSLSYVCAYHEERLIGFVNMAWNGGVHAFILDTTVHPDRRRRGVGQQLVRTAALAAQEHGIEWLHVDFEPHLRGFYEACGFRYTDAGLMNLATSTG